MGDLDNIIYIVATIVIFVVSLLGQKKKKVQVPVAEKEEDGVYSLNDFEKILERKQEYRQQEQVVDEIEEPIKIEKPKEVEELQKKKLKKTQAEEENQDGFDVKSAIIYSSILERKKFRH
jgi:hypothetical protein